MLHRSEFRDAGMKPETGTRVEEYCAVFTEQKLLSTQQERTRINGLLEFAKGPFNFDGPAERKSVSRILGTKSPSCLSSGVGFPTILCNPNAD
jgi:hypothetical protein